MTPQHSDTTGAQHAHSKTPQRVKLKHVLIDVGLANHHKLKSLKRLHGTFGKSALYESYMSMGGATNGVIDRDAILSIAEDNDVEDAEAWLDYCVTRGLIVEELGGFSNQRVIDDQESLARAQKRWRDSKGKQQGVHEDSTETPRGSDEERARKSELSEQLNTEDLKIKIDTPTWDLPVSYDTPQIRHALGLWDAKLRTQGRRLDQIQVDTLCMKYHDPQRFLDALIYSCSRSKAKNIFDPPDEVKPKDPFQANLDLIAKYKAEEAANAQE